MYHIYNIIASIDCRDQELPNTPVIGNERSTHLPDFDN